MRALASLFLAVVLTACGGGSADTPPPPAPAPTPISSAPTPAPAPAPAPTCTPLAQVSVAIGGDSTNYAIDGTRTDLHWWEPDARAAHSPYIELQANMDAAFGPGKVVVSNYAVPGSTAAMWADQANSADIKLENWGINDMNGGYPQAVYAANILAWQPTIVATQYPTVYADPRELANVATVRGLGLPVIDSYAYIRSLPNWQSYYPDPNSAHVTDALTKMIVDDVMTPVVTQQVARLLCMGPTIQLFGDSTQWLAGPYWQKHYPGRVDNQAVPGTSTAQLLAGTDGHHAEWEHAPVVGDFVVIKFGANDSLSWFNTTPDQFKANLRELLHGIKGTPVLETPDPTLDVNRPNEPLYAQAVRDVAAEMGVALIDTDACWRARAGGWADLIGPDTEHATEAGRAFTVETCVAPVIDRLLAAAH